MQAKGRELMSTFLIKRGRRRALGFTIHWVVGPRGRRSQSGISRLTGEGEGRRRVRAGINIHSVYFMEGKRGGFLKLGIRILQGWESRKGKVEFAPGELVAAEDGESIHSQQAPGQSQSPPPPDEVEFAGRSCCRPGLPHWYSALHVIFAAWGGEFGKEGGRSW